MTEVLERLQAALGERYRLMRELGRGGMATVYLAEDRKHRRQVAVKVLRPELAATLGSERFVREIAIAAKLSHPHILMLIDSGEAEGFLYYVMPYVEGESLRERLERDGTLSVPDAVRITEQVASALSYAHQRGVIHRDIKPENILLAGDQAIVADFGIAHAVEAAGGEKLTGTGLAVGTPAYMSPEQVYGQGEIDGRSDVYALGCVVFEMVTGRAPFEGNTPHAALVRHAVDPVPSPRAIDPRLPLFVERAVQRALAKDPAARFATPTDFAQTLAAEVVVPRPGRRRWLATAASLAGIAAMLLGLNVGGVRERLAGNAPTPLPIRLAVLPFENLTGDPEQDYLSEGLTEELITQLGRLHPQRLSVIARTSAMRYKGTNAPIDEIGAALGVDYVLAGSARREGRRVRISTQLIQVHSQAQVWGESYERDLASILAVQNEVARGVAGSLALALLPEEQARLASARQVNPEAHEAYLKGRFHWYRFTPEDFALAVNYFQEALRIDPDYALAYVGLADAVGTPGHTGLVPATEVFPAASEAVAQALELDPELAAAVDLDARIRFAYDWDWSGAEAGFQRAIELNPSYPDAHVVYAQVLRITGRQDAALAAVQRGLDVDPHNPFFQQQLALQLAAAGRYAEATARMQALVAAQPNFPPAHLMLWMTLYREGRYEEALHHAMTFLRDPELAEVLTSSYASAGYRGAMRRAAETLVERSPQRYVAPVQIATFYAHAGDTNAALEWLEKAIDVRDTQIVYTPIRPDFEELRDHPRFRAIMRRINLPS